MTMLKISPVAASCARQASRSQSSSVLAVCIELPLRSRSTTLTQRFWHAGRRHTRQLPSTKLRCFSTSARDQRAPRVDTASSPSDFQPLFSRFSNPATSNPEHAARLARNEYGDRLPADTLSGEALKVYKRLYGEPLPLVDEQSASNDLQSRNDGGSWESVSARLEQGESFSYELIEEDVEEDELEEDEDDIDREPDMETEGDDLFDSDPGYVRTHPYTMANRFGTSPSTLLLPQKTMVQPVAAMLEDSAKPKHFEMITQRVFGGLGLPYSPSTPALSRTMPQRPVALSARQSKMPPLDADAYLIGIFPHAYASITSALVEVRKRLGSEWLRELLTKPGGPVVLDAGAGGAAALAWKEIAAAEWAAMQEEVAEAASGTTSLFDGDMMHERQSAPTGKTTVIVGSETLRARASKLLDNTTFIPRLPDAVPAEQAPGSNPRTQYDVILAPYSLWRIEKEFERKYHVQTLWSLLKPAGGILILLEKGVPRGFEAIAGAREHLLKRHFRDSNLASESQPMTADGTSAASDADAVPKESAMIIAPCTNHSVCPLYTTAGIGRGRKDYCYFSQRFIRPSYLQSALGARRRNHEDVEFSYIAVQRGVDLRAAQPNTVTQGADATNRAFAGFGNETLTTRTGDRRERKARPHASTMDSNIFAEAEANSVAELDDTTDATAITSSPAPHSLTLPRLILPPLKRKGHIVLDVCTSSGTFERWLVTRRNGKQAYRDARKAKWGDLWALGAKTREPRRIRAGEVQKSDKGHKKSSRGRRKKELREMMEESGLLD